MTNDGAPQRQTRNRLRHEPPLYDARYEHDACGVGFVADAGGRSSARILALALGGLGALGHRGAFAADGASSDGAGVLLPLTPSLVRVLDPNAIAGERPGLLTVFAPARRRVAPPETGSRAIVEAALAEEGLPAPVWRRVPLDAAALGREAAASLPVIEQALVPRPDDLAETAFELALACARRRADASARSLGLDGFAVVSASSRTVVYKGLVAGGRLAQLFPDLGAPIDVPFAMFHQRYATNTSPVWSLAQPFAFVAHNGEINTVRGNREAVRGRRDDAGIPSRRREAADRLRAAGPLLSPGVSDSRSLDEALELLVATGWSLESALLALVPEATALRRTPHPAVAAFRRRVAGFVAPWDGPGAFVFSDGRRVGALLDRNGLRPAAWSLTADRVVAVASEAGAVPLSPGEIVRTGRLAPGELLLVDPAAGRILTDADAKSWVLRRLPLHDAPREVFADGDGSVGVPVIEPPTATAPESATPDPDATSPALRYLFGLDAEKLRLDVRTMALDAHEPLWSMGDDTPLTGRGRVTRPVSDHLRQAFAQVTNPPIDPERERAVMDLQMELGRRPALLGGMPLGAVTVRVGRPVVVDLEGLLDAVRVRSRAPHRAVRTLDATWPSSAGQSGLEDALDRLATEALDASRGGAEVVVLSDVAASLDDGRLPVPSVLAAGAVHTALAEAGLRGRTDIVIDAGDVLDVHGLAMVVAAGARVVHPRLLLELVREQAGSRGAEQVSREAAIANVLTALDAGLRKVLARMGISTVASYVGGQLFETLELGPDLVARCFPAAAAWPGRLEAADLATVAAHPARGGPRARVGRPPGPAPRPRLRPVPQRRRAPPVQPVERERPRDPRRHRRRRPARRCRRRPGDVPRRPPPRGCARPRRLPRAAATHGDPGPPRRGRGRPLDRAPLRRVGDERGRAVARGPSRPDAGHPGPGRGREHRRGRRGPGVVRPGRGRPTDRLRRSSRSPRPGSASPPSTSPAPTSSRSRWPRARSPARAASCPGRKVTAYIASLRRAQPGQALISPPPHHDIYSIEDLAQLIADLRAINPIARIGVKLVATRGVGTIASGVTKAGADYIHLSGHAGGTGASPLSSIKHVGAPWELGLSEVHQSLLRNDLRDRVALRTDGGLQTGDDLLIAALLGAEEYAFGTGALVAVGCDMARQCHLDTCPTGIATQREDLRAKFTGTPEMVVAFFLRIAEDLRRSLAAVGARSVGEVVGEGRRYLREAPGSTIDLSALLSPAWTADAERRATPWAASRGIERQAASGLESRLVAAFDGQDGGLTATGLRVTTAERSFGAALTGAIRRGELQAPVKLTLGGAAGQSFGAWAGEGVSLVLEGTANDYVGKGLSGGHLVVRPAPEMVAGAGPGLHRAGVIRAGRQHLPVRRDRRAAPRRRAGRDAVRDPQLGRRGGRRGPRPARLRVHDRRHRRRAGPGRARASAPG